MTFKKPKEETALATRIMFALSALPNVWVWENQIGVAVYDSGARVAYGLGGAGAPDLVVEVGYSPVGASPGSFIVVAVLVAKRRSELSENARGVDRRRQQQ